MNLKPATKRKKDFGVRLNEEEKHMKEVIKLYKGHGYLSDLFRLSLREEYKRLEKQKIIK